MACLGWFLNLSASCSSSNLILTWKLSSFPLREFGLDYQVYHWSFQKDALEWLTLPSGKFLKTNECTKHVRRAMFARVYMEINLNPPLVTSINLHVWTLVVIMNPSQRYAQSVDQQGILQQTATEHIRKVVRTRHRRRSSILLHQQRRIGKQ